MPVEYIQGRQRPSIDAWQRYYEAKGCGVWKAIKLAYAKSNRGKYAPGDKGANHGR